MIPSVLDYILKLWIFFSCNAIDYRVIARA